MSVAERQDGSVTGPCYTPYVSQPSTSQLLYYLSLCLVVLIFLALCVMDLSCLLIEDYEGTAPEILAKSGGDIENGDRFRALDALSIGVRSPAEAPHPSTMSDLTRDEQKAGNTIRNMLTRYVVSSGCAVSKVRGMICRRQHPPTTHARSMSEMEEAMNSDPVRGYSKIKRTSTFVVTVEDSGTWSADSGIYKDLGNDVVISAEV